MSDAPTRPAVIPANAETPPCPADAADWARPFALRQLEMLGELAELGLDVARAVERQASGRAEPPVVAGPIFRGDIALAYARVSRAVRLTLMLQAKLIEDLKAQDAGADQARTDARPAPDGVAAERQRKARIERIVERLAEAEYPDDDDAVADLMTEAGERLDDEDLYGDLMHRPLSELVARLCKDLGLEPRWAELAEELWAVREVESGQVGWPLARREADTPSPAGGGGSSYAGLSEKQTLERALADLDAAFPPLPNSS
jgi:hypothetical protein